MSEYDTILVPPDQCRRVWKDVRDLLRPAVLLSSGRWTLDYILAALVLGEQSLWVIVKDEKVAGTLTTEISHYPGKKMLTIHFLGGTDFGAWYPDSLEIVSKYARECECTAIECNGRNGFWKYFEPSGFKRVATFYEKLL